MNTQEALDLLEREHQALLQFVYLAPVGLVQVRSDGEIVMVNPTAAQLLMPLSRDGMLDNLFMALREVAPDLQDLLDTGTPASGVVCDGLQLPVQVGQGTKSEARLLSFSLIRIDADHCMALLQDVTAQVRREHRLRQQEAWLSAILSGVMDYCPGHAGPRRAHRRVERQHPAHQRLQPRGRARSDPGAVHIRPTASRLSA